MPFGITVQVSGDLHTPDLLKLNPWFFSPKHQGNPVFIDLGEVGLIEAEALDGLLELLQQAVEIERAITLVRASSVILNRMSALGIELPVWKSDSLEEAVFPFKPKPAPKGLEKALTREVKNTCPACGQAVRPRAFRCLQCGHVLKPRRRERTSVSIPFFYGRIRAREFLQSEWIGSVTEDLDVHSFSGVGFFSARALRKGAEVHFIFPTLTWEFTETSDSTLVIFTGRVKHCTPVGHWYRVGVALIDMFEYNGRFRVQEDDDLS